MMKQDLNEMNSATKLTDDISKSQERTLILFLALRRGGAASGAANGWACLWDHSCRLQNSICCTHDGDYASDDSAHDNCNIPMR